MLSDSPRMVPIQTIVQGIIACGYNNLVISQRNPANYTKCNTLDDNTSQLGTLRQHEIHASINTVCMRRALIRIQYKLPYSGLLLQGTKLREICEHHLDSQKFLLVAKDLNVFVQHFYRKNSLMP